MTEKAPGTGQQQYYIGLAVVAVTLIAIVWFFFRSEDAVVAEPEPIPVPGFRPLLYLLSAPPSP